jgi:glycosyltransferase involved in cell wall biosynthesis
MKKKVLFIIDTSVGGESIAVRRLITALKNDGSYGCEILQLTKRVPSKKRFTFIKRLWEYFSNSRKKIQYKISEFSPDYVFASDYLWLLATLSVRKKCTKVIFSFHGNKSVPFLNFSYIDYRQIIIKILERIALLKADAVTLPSEHSFVYMKKTLGPLFDKNKFFYLRNIIPSDFFVTHGDFNNKKLTVIYSGRIEQNKGIENLILAISKYVRTGKDIILIIAYPKAGTNLKVLNFIKRLIKINNIAKNVVFKKNLSTKELVENYKKSDVLILSSDIEFAPLSVLEAYAAGTPAITTMVGNLKYIVGRCDKNLLLSENSPQEIYKHLVSYSRYSLQRRYKLGLKCRFIAKEFDEGNAIKNFKIMLNFLENNKPL